MNMKKIWVLASILLFSTLSYSQLIKRLGDRAKRRVEQKLEQKVDQKVDKSVDDVLDGKKKPKKQSKKSNQSGNDDAAAAGSSDNTGTSANGSTVASGGAPSFKTYSKFDFVPGEKIIVQEDFSQDALGDFPAKWNTNGSGELVTVEGREGKWLSLARNGVFMPEFITDLPDNFTLEFELMCNPNYDYYSAPLYLYMAALSNRKDFAGYKLYGPAKKEGVELWFHPLEASYKLGRTGFKSWQNGKEAMGNNTTTAQFFSRGSNTHVKISIWRQKQRVRVYMNEEKVLDVPRAFAEDKKYNTVLFMTAGMKDGDQYLISNIRLAVGAPDTRSKLITEGKYVTRGILFDVNSDRIKPESYGVLKEIATVLTENADVRVKVIGHTDSDGDEKFNLDLSKRRAEAVKNALVKEFRINANRLETDGKGESEPADKNDTPEGKANNRRVEFVKL
jgi:OOP family OmpA-OmpF porin